MTLKPEDLGKKHQAEDHWIPLRDLMTGVMMIFLLVALAYMIKVEAEIKKVKEIAIVYDQLRTELYQDLEEEFKQDLPKWGAELDRDSTIRFKEPEVLFSTGKDELKPMFKLILDDFFPRYMKILTSAKYRNAIQEVRIEGHTSSIWNNSTTNEEAYFLNMALSQARTRSTVHYVLELPSVASEAGWLRTYLTANGLSSSKLVVNEDGTENFSRSQRVEFRVRTDAESRIARIIETSK